MKVAFLEGKVYTQPKRIKTKFGKEVLSFSIGINNNYKDKSGNYVQRPMTYINLICHNPDLFDVIENIRLKQDKVSLLATFDIVEEKADSKIVKNTYYSLVAISVNNDKLYGAYKTFKDHFTLKEDLYVPPKETDKEDDLPF